MLHADPDVLYEHTTRFDRTLARAFIIPWMLFGIFAITLMLLDICGFFN
jgi:hypothetical protein